MLFHLFPTITLTLSSSYFSILFLQVHKKIHNTTNKYILKGHLHLPHHFPFLINFPLIIYLFFFYSFPSSVSSLPFSSLFFHPNNYSPFSHSFPSIVFFFRPLFSRKYWVGRRASIISSASLYFPLGRLMIFIKRKKKKKRKKMSFVPRLSLASVFHNHPRSFFPTFFLLSLMQTSSKYDL